MHTIKAPCTWPGCSVLVLAGERRCAKHRKQEQTDHDARRGSATSRGYDWKWRQHVRPAALRDEPLCRFCAQSGRTVAASVVDHVDGNSRNNARTNLRPLCKPCHDARTARDQGFGRRLGRGD